MIAAPRVTIVTSVRDAGEHLDAAFESISAQTCRDWEWLVADDGSRDGSDARIAAWARRDPRIRLLARVGTDAAGQMVALLNQGIAEARAPLIARMDGDDVARPERLEAQVSFLERNPRITVVDSQVEPLGAPPGGGEGMRRFVAWVNSLAAAERGGGESHAAIARDILVESPLVQPAVMMRRDAVLAVGGYRAGDFPEDYDLWLRLLLSGERFAKIPRVLLDWRDSATRLTRTDPRYRPAAFFALKKEALWALDGEAIARGPLAVWGAGGQGRVWRRLLRERGVRPAFFIDIDPRKIGRVLLGAPVLPPDALRERAWSYLLGVVAAPGARDLIRGHLAREGFLDANGDATGDRLIRFVQ